MLTNLISFKGQKEGKQGKEEEEKKGTSGGTCLSLSNYLGVGGRRLAHKKSQSGQLNKSLMQN